MRGKLTLLTIVVVGLIGLNGFFVFESWKNNDNPRFYPVEDDSVARAYILPISEASYIPVLDSNVPKPHPDAKSVLVYDMRTSRFLYSKDPMTRLPIASLTKIMTATVAVENLKLTDVVNIPREAIKVDGQRQDLYLGEQLTVENLIKIMLVASSNDAAYALALYAKHQGIDLVALMNSKATSLAMYDSSFVDPAGLNDQGYSTAHDLSKIVKYAFKYPLIWDTLKEKEVTINSEDGSQVHHVINTDQLIGVIPDIIGGKTGYTDGALGCLILLVQIPQHNDTIISIVLGSHDRFGDTKEIINWIKQAYRWN